MWTYFLQWIRYQHDRRIAIRNIAIKPISLQEIGLFIEALTSSNAKIVQTAENALLHILPKISSSDAHLFNEYNRYKLCRYINIDSPRPDLAIAIILAMRYVGDYSVMPYIENLSESDPLTRSQQRMVLVAQESLPALRKMSAHVNAPQTLLRPASVPSPSTTILRQLDSDS